MSTSSSAGKGKSASVSGNSDHERDEHDHGGRGREDGDKIRGGRGNDVLTGTAGSDEIDGGGGNDTIYGLAGNDELNGNAGDDTIYGGAGRDEIKGDTGNDTVDGGSGSDEVDAGSGNDVAIYVMSENTGAKDEYDGGSGSDTLRLVFTRDEWMRADVQADVARYLAFLAANTNPSGQANGHEFEFRAFNLEVEKFEKLEVMVDGQMLDPRDEAVNAVDDSAVIDEDASISGNVLTNDAVPDLVRSVELVTGPAHGALAFNADGSYTYTPGSYFNSLAQGETATETFVYRVTDADGDTDTATVTITITGTNDGPVAIADAAAGQENEALIIDVLANDSDVDHNAVLHVSAASVPAGQGAVTINPDNTLAFDPGSDFDHLAQGASATVTITYTVADEHGAEDTKSVTVTITGTNDAPVVTSGAQAGSVQEDTTQSVSGQVTSTDVDHGATAAYSGNATGAYGSFAVDAATGAWTYTLDNAAHQDLAAGETHQEIFTVTVTDDQGATATQDVTVTITGTNDAPVIAVVTDAGAATEDGALIATGQLTASDVDHGANQTWTVQGAASSAYGSMAVNGSGQWTYALANGSSAVQALAAGQTYNDVFTIRVTDDQGAFADHTVTVTVTGTNDIPVVAAFDVTGGVTESGAPSGNLTDSGTLAFADVDLADVHGIGAVTPSAGALGTLTAAVTADTTGGGSGGEVTWNYSVDAAAVEYLAAGQTKVETFTFDVLDGQGGSVPRTVSVTLTGTNDAPVIAAADASGAVTAVPVAPEAAPAPLAFTVQQFLGFQSNDLNTLRNYATTHAANYTVQTAVIDYTDDPGGFAGELPGSNRWPAAEAQNVTGTGGINNVFFARITADFSVSAADTYTFRTYNDDGVFLLIDNTLVISDTGYHPEAPFQGSIALAPGNHTIELFFYENGGEASLEFSARNSTGTFGLVGANGGGLGGAIAQVTDSGVISFSDVDLTDGHVVSAAPVGATLGTLSVTENADTTGTGTGGQLTWSYAVANSAIAYLDAGETKVESFTVTVNDGHGGVATQQVDVTITGTNDVPVITGGATTGAVTEDGASSATGQLIVLDADHNATQTWTVAGGTASGDANYQFRADSFTVLRNGTTFFQDDFSDGVAPPSAPTFPGTNGYAGIGANAGALSESGGKLVFDSSAAILLEGTGTTDPIVGQNAILRSNIDPTNAAGLKSTADFSIQAVFDLVLPDSPRESYGIRATDRLVGGPGTPPDQPGDDTIELMVRESLTGKLQVALREIDNAADQITNLQVLALNAPAGADQIRLRLDHSTSDVGALHASFEYLSGGAIVGSQAFTAVGRIFGTETPGDASDDENWTRAEILARAPLHDDSVLTGQYGNLNVNQSGEWTYTLDNGRAATQGLAAGQTATDVFTVQVADEHGATDSQTVTVTVTGTNDAPVILTPPVSRTMGEDGAGHQLAATGLMQFDDVDLTDTHTVSAALQSASVTGGGALPAGLQAALSGAMSTVLTNPAQDGHGDLQWSFALNDAATQFLNAGQTLTAVYNVTVSDGTAAAVKSVTVNITGANDNPVAVNDAGALTVTSVASQVQTNVVNWVDWTSASGGTVSGTIDVGNGQTIGVTYTGEYFFAQTNGGTNYYNLTNGTVPVGTYTSAAVANGPNGSSDIIALSQATQKTLTFSTPVDNLFFAIVSLNGNGYLFDQDFSILSYGPGFFGTGSATKLALGDGRYEVIGNGELHGVLGIAGTVQSLTWTSVTPETWNGFTVGTYGKAQTSTVSGNLLANDTPGNAGDTLAVTAVNGQAIPGNYIALDLASGARLTVNKDGTYLYDEDSAFAALGQGATAQDAFTYTLTDNHGVTATATATITVTGINDGPVAVNDSAVTNEDTPVTINVLANDTDVDSGDAKTLVSVQNATHGTASVAGNDVVFTPDANYNGAASFSYTMKDAAGATSTATVSLTVNPVNDGPFATNDGATTAEDTPITINVLANDTDADGDALTVTGFSGLSHGTAQIVGNKIVFTPNANFSGTELFSYTVSDGHGGTDTAGVVVNVTPVNDAPVLTSSLRGGTILFVDDDRGLNGQSTWLTALAAKGYTVDYEAIAANGDPVRDLAGYGAVIWSNGDQAYTNLTAENVATLQAYLNSGGRLLYAGGHNLYSEPYVGAFAQNYLGVNNYQGNMPYINAGTPASGELGPVTLSPWAGGYYGGTMLSGFYANGGTSRTLLEFSNGNDIAAINSTSTFRAATWGFDLNQLDAAYRNNVLDGTLKALGISLATNEDTALSLAGLTVSDVDAGTLSVVLSAAHGDLGVTAVAGLSGLTGNGSGSLTLTGSAAALNQALATLSYTPDANYNGTDALNVGLSDLGNSGAGGVLTASSSYAITVRPVSDTHVLSNLIVNGSFEQFSGGGTSAGSTAITGWTVTGSDVDRVASSGWQSGDGLYSLDLNGFHPGGVQQVLQTTPGVQYTVGFELSKNPGNTTFATVLVSATGSSQPYTFSDANSAGDMKWSQQTFTFVATGTSTTLSFASTYPTDATGAFPINAQGPALDEVVVVSNKAIDGFTKGAGGDVLQLHDVLTSVNAPHDGTAFSGGFLRFLQSGSDTLVQVDANGGGNGYLTLATLTNTLLTQADTANYTL